MDEHCDKENKVVVDPNLGGDSSWLSDELNPEIITCEFLISAAVGFEGGKFAGWSYPEKKPHVVTFVDVNSGKPRIKGNLGTGPLLRVSDDGNDLVLVERTEGGNVNTFSINRRSRIAVLSKAYFFLDKPAGYLMLGRFY